jgi:hypothetical protein
LMYEEEQRFNMSKKEEVVPRYKLVLPPYYWKEHEDEDQLEERAQNFELQIHYVVEQKAITLGIRMSKRVELILVTK